MQKLPPFHVGHYFRDTPVIAYRWCTPWCWQFTYTWAWFYSL